MTLDTTNIEYEMLSHFQLSPQKIEKLKIYHDLLLKWQKAINLVSRGTLEDFWSRHIHDSLQIIPYLKGDTILDIGSGGGFPGMVLAIVSNLNVTCLDSDIRKMQFLSEVSRLTETKVNLVNMRVENFTEKHFDTICARGFSELKNLLSLVSEHSRLKYGVFLKGKSVEKEIGEALKLHDFHYTIKESETSKEGCILIVEDVVSKNI